MWDGREGMWKSWEVKNTTTEVKMRLFPSWPSLVTFPLKGIHHTQFPSKRNYKMLELTMYRWAPSWIFVPSSSQSFLAMMSTSSPGHLPRFDVTSYKGLSPVFQPCGQKKRKKTGQENSYKNLVPQPAQSYFRQAIISWLSGFSRKNLSIRIKPSNWNWRATKRRKKCQRSGKRICLMRMPKLWKLKLRIRNERGVTRYVSSKLLL